MCVQCGGEREGQSHRVPAIRNGTGRDGEGQVHVCPTGTQVSCSGLAGVCCARTCAHVCECARMGSAPTSWM